MRAIRIHKGDENLPANMLPENLKGKEKGATDGQSHAYHFVPAVNDV